MFYSRHCSKSLTSILTTTCCLLLIGDFSVANAENIAPAPSSHRSIGNGEFLEDMSESSARLEQGSAVVKTSKACHITTPHGSADISRGAIVLISAEPDMTRFFVLCEPFGGSVKVSSEKHFKRASSGSEVDVIDSNSADIALQKILRDGVRRRKLRVHPSGDSAFISTGQYSIPDAILKEPLLVDIHASKEKARKRIYSQIVKTAAAISVSGSREPYSIHN